jgi:hypothetical protein
MSAAAASHPRSLIAVDPGGHRIVGLDAARRFREDFRQRSDGPTPPEISFYGVIKCDPVFVQHGLADGLAEEWKRRRRLAWATDISDSVSNQLDAALRQSGLMMIGKVGELLGADRAMAETLAAAKTIGPSFSTPSLARTLGLAPLIMQNRLVSLLQLGMVGRAGRQRWRVY